MAQERNTTPATELLDEINQHIGIIHKVCRVYFRNEEDRQDCFQEILYQLWRSYPGFKHDSKFTTWMYRVALNTAMTHSKKSRRADHAAIENVDPIYLRASDNADDDDRLAQLYQCIDTLNDTDKAIILLSLESNSYEEISLITGLTKTNVSVRLVRIRNVIKEKMNLIK